MGEALIESYFAAYIPPGHVQTTPIVYISELQMARMTPFGANE